MSADSVISQSRNGNIQIPPPTQGSREPSHGQRRQPMRQETGVQPKDRYPPTHPTPNPRPVRQGSNDSTRSNGLTSDIRHLLGPSGTNSKTKPPPRAVTRPGPPNANGPPPVPFNNDFQVSWLAHPDPAFSVPQTARTGSVYLPVTKPKDRPMIAPGGLAPAPPPKVKAKMSRDNAPGGVPSAEMDGSGDGGSRSAGGPGGNKWADRLRSRR